jgi:hypothetical protein
MFALKEYVANVCFKCFRSTLQLFYIDVAKVGQDVAHVAMAIYVLFQVYVSNVFSVADICCKCFYLNIAKIDLNVTYTCMLQAYVSSVSYVCCKCFIWMLYMFVMSFKCFKVFCKCLQTYVAIVSAVFRRMLQVFHMGVSKVDIVLHICCNGTHLLQLLGDVQAEQARC